MKPHHQQLFDRVRADRREQSPDASAAIHLPALVDRWLAEGPDSYGSDRAAFDAICRSIDVRKHLSSAYGEGWRKLPTSQRAAPNVASGLIAVLLANASMALDSDRGWSLKCVNSALKALDLYPSAPHRPELQAWAWEVLDVAQRTDPRP